MKVIFSIRTWFLHFSLAATSVITVGCNADQSVPNSDGTRGAPSARPIEDLEKDLRPPVIIKPSAPPAADAERAQSK
jgi:hypothetical protein